MKTAVTIEISVLEKGVEWDYTMRRHHLPAGGKAYMTDLMTRVVLCSELEEGVTGDFETVVRVDGSEIVRLVQLSKEDVQEIEDRLVAAYIGMRDLKPKKGKGKGKKSRIKRFKKAA